jgi:hypothetical protein
MSDYERLAKPNLNALVVSIEFWQDNVLKAHLRFESPSHDACDVVRS